MDDIRMMSLLRNAVEHIEAFEDHESENVLRALGFTENDLAEIRFTPEMDAQDLKNISMVCGKVFHHGEVIWELSSSGNEYIFSDFGEKGKTLNGYISENVPFKKYSHYFYYDEFKDVYCGYAYYNPAETYVADFKSLEDCLDWLVPERELESEMNTLDARIQSASERSGVQPNKDNTPEINR